MSEHHEASDLRDLSDGIDLEELNEGRPLFGRVEGEAVYLLKVGEAIRAFGATCTHYGGPLAEGLVHDGTIRCPWHHARFSLEDGRVEGGPAFNPLPRIEVSIDDGRVFVGKKTAPDPVSARRSPPSPPDSIVVVGAGPAGQTAVDTLLREGFTGELYFVDPDPDAPYDRPNLSKDFLAGAAPEEWLPLRSDDFYADHGVERVQARVATLDAKGHRVRLESGDSIEYGKLLLATGSTPRRIDVPGAGRDHVHTLRSLSDCRAIIEAADRADRIVVVGASFIGMEVAASLRSRGLDVTVVAPQEIPFEKTLGHTLGERIRALHETHGVEFRLHRTVVAIHPDHVVLDGGEGVRADLVVVGIGVDPATTLASKAGLDIDDGVVVDECLCTSDPDIYAAGDIARYPDAISGRRVRIEHWVVAGRQGRTAARNMVGLTERFDDVPFFWTHHFGKSIAYVGHAERWDDAAVSGDCNADDCAVRFSTNDRTVALATIGRSDESLRTEAEWEDEEHGS